MLDDVVSGLILAALMPGSGDGQFFMRRKGKAFLRGKAVTLPAYLEVDGERPRHGRLRLRPNTDDLE